MLSFFTDGPAKPGSGPIVSKVVVKKQVVKPLYSGAAAPRPIAPLQSKASSSSSSSKLKNTSSGSNASASKLGSPSYKSSNNASSSSSSSNRLQPPSSSGLARTHLKSTSGTSSRDSTPMSKKRKPKANTIDRVQSMSPSSEEDTASPAPPKRNRVASNSVFSGPGTPTSGLENEARVGRSIFCLDKSDERGEWGRGWCGFIAAEETVKGERRGWSEQGKWGEERSMLDKYLPYFPQPGFNKGDAIPCVELLYPAKGCKERYPLLFSTSPGEFGPLSELRSALRIILDFYIPPSHKHIFGTLSDSLELSDNLNSIPSRVSSPLPPNGSSTPPPPPSEEALVPRASTPSASLGTSTETIADSIRRALAPNRRDGPGFLKAMDRFNEAMEEIQEDGSMDKWLKESGRQMKERDWNKMVEFVHDQAYSRIVGPYSAQLEHHPKHPDEVAKAISAKEDAYGELRHTFMSRIISQTDLGPSSVFVDLGSGVGNCVLQAALQAGCSSYGFELLPVPAHCARLQVREVIRRWSMWGLNGELDIAVHEGDFRTLPEVSKRLRQADVVLVNNEVFPSTLNNDLTDLFLDLKDGAKIVSLKPFVAEGFRMNESNCDSFAAIVRITTHTYHQNWVSWKGDGGKYYVQTIDRSMRRRFEEQLNGGRRQRG